MTFAYDGEMKENTFCYRELTEVSKGQVLFKVLSLCLQINVLCWRNAIDIDTGVAPSVVVSIRVLPRL